MPSHRPWSISSVTTYHRVCSLSSECTHQYNEQIRRYLPLSVSV